MPEPEPFNTKTSWAFWVLALEVSMYAVWIRAIPNSFESFRFIALTTLIPVPTNESLADKPGNIKLSSEELEQFINKVTVTIDQ